MIREVVFYDFGYPNDKKRHRITDFNFKITPLFKPVADANYKIEFDYIHREDNRVERISAFVKLPYWKYWYIKFTKGDYWITSKEIGIGFILGLTFFILEKLFD